MELRSNRVRIKRSRPVTLVPVFLLGRLKLFLNVTEAEFLRYNVLLWAVIFHSDVRGPLTVHQCPRIAVQMAASQIKSFHKFSGSWTVCYHSFHFDFIFWLIIFSSCSWMEGNPLFRDILDREREWKLSKRSVYNWRESLRAQESLYKWPPISDQSS